MDLLDDIEDVSVNFKTILPLNESEEDISDTNQNSDDDLGDSCLGFNFDAVPLEGADLSILDKVRNRLLNTGKADEQTQEIEQDLESTADDMFARPSIFGLGTEVQQLPQLQVDESDFMTQTQQIATQQVPDPTQQIHTQHHSSATQMIQTQIVSTQAQDATQFVPSQVHTQDAQDQTQLTATQVVGGNPFESTQVPEIEIEDRETKLARLVEAKRQQRQKEEHEKELIADVSHVTLTDEENELNQHEVSVSADNYRDGIVSTKDLQQAEEFINIQKRNRDIRPEFERKVMFTKDSLLAAFADDDDDFSESNSNTNAQKSTPATSPLKSSHGKATLPQDLTSSTQNPIDVYTQSLKLKLSSSPSSKFIDLDSDSDLELQNLSSPVRMPLAASSSPIEQTNSKIPELSKVQKLMIKQRFSRKKIKSNLQSSKPENTNNAKASKNFLNDLRKSHIEQLKIQNLANPNHVLMEEIQKDEEIMGSLLEREMERARNVRRKERLREKAKLALLSQSFKEPDNNEDLEQVPESEVGESDYSVEESEDEEEDESPGQPLRSDDSYMFGDVQDDDFQEGIPTSAQKSQSHSVTVTTNPRSAESYELFQNLKPREDSSLIASQERVTAIDRNLPEFQDLTQGSLGDTQADLSTQVDQATQVFDLKTQVDSEDDEEDFVKTRRRRAVIVDANEGGEEDLGAEGEDEEEEEDDDEIEEEDPEAVQERIKMYEDKIRKREFKLRKKRQELERKGLKNIVHGEAEESEDEWQGLGGADGELSDYQANSDDEKMIDNDFRIDLKNEEVRRKFMEEHQIKDQEELEKLLDDIKNHRLTKKVAGNGFDVELSDEEDELLAAYRKQRLMEQQSRLLESKKLHKISKNEKTKAFFTSIQEEPGVIKLDDDSEDEEEVVQTEEATSKASQTSEVAKPAKKTYRVDESFIQRQLSFLTAGNDEENYEREQMISKLQHDFNSDDELDIQALKSQSLSRLTSTRSQSSTDIEPRKRSIDNDTDVDDDEGILDDDLMPVFKKPSFIKSFKSFHEQQSIQIKDGKQFTGVTISNQYKVASGSKSSINYSSRTTHKQMKSTKEMQIERTLKISKNSKKLFSSSGFDS